MKMADTDNDDSFGPGVTDLVNSALEQKPVDFQATFNNMLRDKISDAVAQRKLDLASTIALDEPEEVEDEVEDEEVYEEEPESEDDEGEVDSDEESA